MMDKLKALFALQTIRYLAVGGFNTVFGYGLYAWFTWLLKGVLPHAYELAYLLSNMISITVAFLGYKWFVFRTKGNYLREWIRCVTVYSTAIGLNLLGLPLLVTLISKFPAYKTTAPYLAGIITTAFTVMMSFFGHKHISFKPAKTNTPSHPAP